MWPLLVPVHGERCSPGCREAVPSRTKAVVRDVAHPCDSSSQLNTGDQEEEVDSGGAGTNGYLKVGPKDGSQWKVNST